MVSPRDADYLVGLVHRLRSLPRETEWLEFKLNFSNNQEIGRYISALSNGAALNGKTSAYLVWGIEDETHEVKGTNFDHVVEKQGNEPLENWLSHNLNPRIDFRFGECDIDGRRIVVLEISPTSYQPVAFQNEEFIRVGSVRTRLREHPEKEQALWRVFERNDFENGIAAERLRDDEVLRSLNYPVYFDSLDLPLPEGTRAILDSLSGESFITPCDAGDWNITNLGAILLARNLNDFNGIRRLGRKALRVVQHDGIGRVATKREREFAEGYAVSFQSMIDYIMALLPANEVIENALRRSMPMFPEIAMRELVANALIHQDLNVTGSGPIVEIFDDRIEITSPGGPLVPPERFVDQQSRSRNEGLAWLMRRFKICEELGSGIDKVVEAVELFQLPPPLFSEHGNSTVAIMFAPKPFAKMDKTERIRACYQHACLRWVMKQPTNNASVRARFGLADSQVAVVSRLLGDAVAEGVVSIRDSSAGSKNRTYLPSWAK